MGGDGERGRIRNELIDVTRRGQVFETYPLISRLNLDLLATLRFEGALRRDTVIVRGHRWERSGKREDKRTIGFHCGNKKGVRRRFYPSKRHLSSCPPSGTGFFCL